MNVSRLALAGVLLAALTSTAAAQNMGYGGMPQGMGYPQQGMYPPQGMGNGAAMPAAYQMMGPEAAQAAPDPQMQGGPGPMGGPNPMEMQGGGSPEGCATCGGGSYADGMPHYWYFDAQLFYARRTTSERQTLVIDAPSGDALQTTSDLSFAYKPGIKTTIGYMFPEAVGIEGTLWGFNQFSSKRTVNGNNNLSLPGDLPLDTLDFFDADQMNLGYQSRINNVELNIVHPYGSVQYLVGFRAMEFDERFNILSTDADTSTSQYNIGTSNRLYGGQVGARMQFQVGRMGIDVQGKAALMGNASHQSQFIDDFTGFVIRDTSTSSGSVAFVGDLGVDATLPLGSVFTLRGGYSATWITGVAMATDQFDTTDTSTSGTHPNLNGSTIVHGFNVGLDAHW